MPVEGVCLWFTGLSGVGKMTLARAVAEMVEQVGRRITMLDGDAVRHASAVPIGFSMGERNAHVRRIGAMASAVVQRGEFAIWAPIVRTARSAIGAAMQLERRDSSRYLSRPVRSLRTTASEGTVRRSTARRAAHVDRN